MLNGLYLAAMGAKVQDARADVVSNNLANVNTPAYRRDVAVFRTRPSETETRHGLSAFEDPRYQAVGGGVFLARIAAMDEAGPLEETGRNLDLAIEGEGYFRVRGEDGAFHYTRAGNLRRDDEGFLVTADGRYRVQGQGGGDLALPDGPLEINAAGEIRADGLLSGQIGLVQPLEPDRLRKRGENLWTGDGPLADREATGSLLQGFREGASVEAVREMAEMISAQRAYEMSLKALKVQDEILGRAVNDIGRLTA